MSEITLQEIIKYLEEDGKAIEEALKEIIEEINNKEPPCAQ